MPRISEVLERESRTVDLEQGDFERLLGRRERKQRNARIRAGAVGIIVALAMGIVFLRALTSDPIPAERPEPRPAPAALGSLVYSLDGDIWVADPDGTNAVRITDVDALDDECPGDVAYGGPSWSPDGRYIASLFGECVDSPRVVITDPQGNVVANFPVAERFRAWSTDSTRIAVWDEWGRDEDGGPFTIGIYGIDGTRETQIALPPGWEPGDLGQLAWTPDGASLIVDQFEVPLDGGTPRELPFPFVRPVVYSPDGSQVAYATRRALMVARPDGSEPREVFGDAPYTETWSPTGELIAVTANAPGGNSPWPPRALHVVDVATGSATMLFEGERRTILWVIGFSPDGDRILFVSFERADSVGSLWSIGVDGSDARRVVAGTSDGEWRSR